MNIEINNHTYEIEIIKKSNKNTYIRVKNGKLIVTTNHFTPRTSIIKLIKDNESSIISMLNKDSKRSEKQEDFYYFGKKYDIIYGFKNFEINNDKIYVEDKKTLDKYLNQSIHQIFETRLNHWYDQYQEKIPIPNLKIRKMTSRWGVCNIKNHNVTLNYHLSKYDIKCLDYVIVHELSHFIHPNHSKDFWLQVEKYCPKYKECRKMLKE